MSIIINDENVIKSITENVIKHMNENEEVNKKENFDKREWYRNYYNNNKEKFKGYREKYISKDVDHKKKDAKYKRDKYHNDPENRARINAVYYKKKYKDDEEFKELLEKIENLKLNHVEKLRNIKEFHFNMKFK